MRMPNIRIGLATIGVCVFWCGYFGSRTFYFTKWDYTAPDFEKKIILFGRQHYEKTHYTFIMLDTVARARGL